MSQKGSVKFYNEGKGFGFIAGDDGREYFVHISGVVEGVRITDNDDVSFEVSEGDRGPKAENVSPSIVKIDKQLEEIKRELEKEFTEKIQEKLDQGLDEEAEHISPEDLIEDDSINPNARFNIDTAKK